MIHVGIDPGLHTCVCAWDSKLRKIVYISTLNFWETIEYFEYLKHVNDNLDGVLVFIENSKLNKPTFVKAGGDTAKKIQKISRNVGSNQRESELLIQGVRRLGFKVVEVKPTGQQGAKRKWTSEYFQKITGINKSSQHARDAAMLVFGR